MYLDFEDHRPDTPRVASVISRREGVLLSLVGHGLFLVFLIFGPPELFKTTPAETVETPPKEPIRFVQMAPTIDRQELTRRLAEQSDLDRRSATREVAPKPENPAPFMRGNTPEKIEGAPVEKAAGPETPQPSAPSAANQPPPDPNGLGLDVPVVPPRQASGNLGEALRNLQRYVQDQNFDNRTGGDTNHSADIQFDSKGVDFGPWLRRFVAQIKRNWIIPQVAELAKGRVVVQFNVLRNGTIVDLRVSQPAGIDALTISALNALKLSNPTAALPSEYPDDHAGFIVTFHYNEGPREVP